MRGNRSMNSSRWLSVVIAMVLQIGCLPSSHNPLPSQGDISSMAEPFLGTWAATEFLYLDAITPVTMEVSLFSNTTVLTSLDDGNQSADLKCLLHQYGASYFISQNNKVNTGYEVFRVELSGAANETMEVFSLDNDLLETAIGEQSLEGIIYASNDNKTIRITDSSANLETYITSSSTVFEASPIMVFERQD
jgi:hypothetical protein